MNTYEVTYILGFDHDDWDKFTVTARDEAEAKKKAIDKVPPGYRVKKIKLIQTHNTMEQTKIQSITPQGTFEHKGKTFHKWNTLPLPTTVEESNLIGLAQYYVKKASA